MLVLNNSELKYPNISNEMFENGELKIAHLQVLLSILFGIKLYLEIIFTLDIVCQK